jgi:hypothetical protein
MYNSKSPFKPIKSTNDPFLDFMKEEAEKTIQEIKAEEEARDDKNFKPQLKEQPAPTKVEKYSVHLQDEDIIIKQKNWAKLIAGLYMDVFNADKSLQDISSEIKNIMNRNGIEVNIDSVDRTIEDTQDRLVKIFIAKNMCHSLGMASEWQNEILSRELDLVYPERPLLGSSKSPSKNKA